MKKEENKSLNFIEEIIEKDLQTGKHKKIITRFPPEPNGYLHIGHAKSICLNFGTAKKFGGITNLRFDDTNPVTENTEYVESIKEDIRWLGFDWENREYYASDYFQQLFDWAILLIKKGLAYVDDSTADEISANRGTPAIPSITSSFRNRSINENIDLFERMKNGEFKDGEKVLRAKIDLASPNMHMRDPIMYRIKHTHHHRTGDKWCIYPTYDYAHGQSDFIEGITHSICTLEFEVHRPLYDWFLDKIIDNPETNKSRTHQFEFARLNINYTVMSKRMLLQLVKENYVCGWDDPRMPTICGLRRRGYTPESLRNFAEKVGVAKRENMIDMGLLEFCIREDLNKTVNRVMGVINPLKVVIDNYPEEQTEELDAVNNPENENAGTHKIPFSKVIYIDGDDFMEEAPKKYFRLSPGQEVRLRYAYFIKCKEDGIIKNNKGEIIELHCTYDPLTKGGQSLDGRKVKGTIHWVAADHALEVEIRLYDRLFLNENPSDGGEEKSFLSNLNTNSLTIIKGFVESSLKKSKPGNKFQFERVGYFCVDKDSTEDMLVFNRTVTLKESWSKIINKT